MLEGFCCNSTAIPNLNSYKQNEKMVRLTAESKFTKAGMKCDLSLLDWLTLLAGAQRQGTQVGRSPPHPHQHSWKVIDLSSGSQSSLYPARGTVDDPPW